jgi:hypothetical protein
MSNNSLIFNKKIDFLRNYAPDFGPKRSLNNSNGSILSPPYLSYSYEVDATLIVRRKGILMSVTLKYLWVLLLVSLALGLTILSTWGIPSPSVEVRKPYPFLGKG